MESESKSNKILNSIFGEKGKEIKKYLVDISEPKREYAVPRGNVINVFMVIRADNELLIRHEGGEDISLATINGEKYPIILNEKLVSGWRRNMLEILRKAYTEVKDNVNEIRGKKDDWFCALRPTAAVKKGKESEERMGGLCTECPNCTTFGFAVQEGGAYNLKSRVEGDLSISTTPESKSVIVRTFNAVDEVTHTTFIETRGERTGALFRLSLVKENTLFVGKVALKDLSTAELLLSLYSLVTLPRIGGNKSDFGRISIEIPAIVGYHTELGSGLDAFLYLKSKGVNMEDMASVLSGVSDYANKFKDYAVVVTGSGFSELIKKKVKGSDLNEVVKEAWKDGLNFKKSIELFIH